MSRQRTKTEIMRHEQYFAKLIEKADNAMREYQQERGGEHRLYVDEYIRRKGLAEYRGHLLRHREQGQPHRPEEPERQKRAERVNRAKGGGLQAERFNRYSVADCLCPTRRRVVSTQRHYLAQGKPYAGKLQRPPDTLL